MTYTVKRKYVIKPEYADSISHSTLEEFKANVLQHGANGEKGEEYYVSRIRSLNLEGWDEREAEFLAARANKVESFDESTKELTIVRTWDSIEQWFDYIQIISLANLEDEFVVLYTIEDAD